MMFLIYLSVSKCTVKTSNTKKTTLYSCIMRFILSPPVTQCIFEGFYALLFNLPHI